jgi:hypothetical protein
MLKDLNTDEASLASYMSNISEKCWSAAWMENLEFELWHAVVTGPKTYGHDLITQLDIDYLQLQSVKANCWIIFQETNEETSISLNEWKHLYHRTFFPPI